MEAHLQKHETQTAQPERTRSGRAYRPNVDIIERADQLMLVADLPGVRAENIDVNYENGVLTLHARVEPRQPAPNASLLLCEYGVGDFVRTFQVGEGIDPARITAETSNGVLTLHLPKTPAARMHRIEVKTA